MAAARAATAGVRSHREGNTYIVHRTIGIGTQMTLTPTAFSNVAISYSMKRLNRGNHVQTAHTLQMIRRNELNMLQAIALPCCGCVANASKLLLCSFNRI